MSGTETIRRVYTHVDSGIEVEVVFSREHETRELFSGERFTVPGLWKMLTSAGQSVGALTCEFPPLEVHVITGLCSARCVAKHLPSPPTDG